MSLWYKNEGYVTSLLCQSSSNYRLGDFISPGDFLPGIGLDNGIEWSRADSTQRAHSLTGRHGVGVARAWNRERPAPRLSAPSQGNKSLTTVITGIKQPSVKIVWFGLLYKADTKTLQNFMYLLLQQYDTNGLTFCFSLKLFWIYA